MTDIYKCDDCGHHTDEPDQITEDEILAELSDPEEIQEALEDVGCLMCPSCGSVNIDIHDSL